MGENLGLYPNFGAPHGCGYPCPAQALLGMDHQIEKGLRVGSGGWLPKGRHLHKR